jgi:aspartyl-tRNA(Asn)/glutamyl-tRNA(Gln) amidotransferase subunit B
VKLIATDALSGKLAKQVFPKMFSTGDAPEAIVEREGLKQISDTGALEKIIAEVIAANPKQVEQYKGGKTTVINFLVGQAMRATRGQANVALVTDLFKQKLG